MHRHLPWILTAVVPLVAVGCNARTTQTESTPETPQVLLNFIRFHDRGEAKAATLLSATPEVPEEPVAQAEADRLNAEFMLRGSYKIESYRFDRNAKDQANPVYILELSGCDKQPLLKILNPDSPRGYDTTNISVTNPDVSVTIADGKIRALGWAMHHDGKEKRMTAEQSREVINAIQGGK